MRLGTAIVSGPDLALQLVFGDGAPEVDVPRVEGEADSPAECHEHWPWPPAMRCQGNHEPDLPDEAVDQDIRERGRLEVAPLLQAPEGLASRSTSGLLPTSSSSRLRSLVSMAPHSHALRRHASGTTCTRPEDKYGHPAPVSRSYGGGLQVSADASPVCASEDLP